MLRKFSQLDQFIGAADQALKALTGVSQNTGRNNPSATLDATPLDPNQQKHVAGLMRINHTGEICAQALYAGQAVTARAAQTRQAMQQAADEELDHLSWCAERLKELDSHTSYLNPFWYSGSFIIGACAGLAGDGWSLGFLRETEHQVEAHLHEHLQHLPENDQRSRAILEQMKIDEAQHAEMADAAGANDLPEPIRDLMKLSAGIMKKITYYL